MLFGDISLFKFLFDLWSLIAGIFIEYFKCFWELLAIMLFSPFSHRWEYTLSLCHTYFQQWYFALILWNSTSLTYGLVGNLNFGGIRSYGLFPEVSWQLWFLSIFNQWDKPTVNQLPTVPSLWPDSPSSLTTSFILSCSLSHGVIMSF